MRALMLLVLAGCSVADIATVRATVDDFESGRARWKDAGSGWKRTSVEIIDGGVGGRRAARVAFAGSGEGQAWTDLTWPVDRWPAGAESIIVWLRAARPCKVMLKVNLGPTHEDLEMWGCPLDLGTEWREHRVPVSRLRDFLWGHKHGDAVVPARIIGIGFAELDFPVTFDVDRIGID